MKLAAFILLPSLLILLVGCAQKETALSPQEWQRYKTQFVTPEGRVVDVQQQGISHSESQGYGMLLAFSYGDHASFQRIWEWSKSHLQIRKDLLFAWRWPAAVPGSGVEDINDASDGDLLIAWALCRAGYAWNEPAYVSEARQICRDIRSRLLRSTSSGLVLLPGVDGFDKPDGLVLNLSYWIFPAFKTLDRCDPSPDWQRLRESGIALLRASRFGKFALPPDWLKLTNTVQLAEGFPPVYGYNAIRIPLYLNWGGEDPELSKPFLAFWHSRPSFASVPATINLRTGQPSPENLSSGGRAICLFTQAQGDQVRISQDSLPPFLDGETYFSASLLLLSKVALCDRQL